MLVLIAGLVLFLGPHSLSIVAPVWRERMIAQMGQARWKGGYSLLSLAGLILICIGFSLARQSPVIVYVPSAGLRALSLPLTLPVFPLLIAAYFPGRIHALVRHPMLVATGLWAFAHLLANGMLSEVVLFGSLLLWSVALGSALSRRPPKPRPTASSGRFNHASAIIVGVIVYLAVILLLHRLVLGVSPLT